MLVERVIRWVALVFPARLERSIGEMIETCLRNSIPISTQTSSITFLITLDHRSPLFVRSSTIKRLE